MLCYNLEIKIISNQNVYFYRFYDKIEYISHYGCPWGLTQVVKGWGGGLFVGGSKFKSHWGYIYYSIVHLPIDKYIYACFLFIYFSLYKKNFDTWYKKVEK